MDVPGLMRPFLQVTVLWTDSSEEQEEEECAATWRVGGMAAMLEWIPSIATPFTQLSSVQCT